MRKLRVYVDTTVFGGVYDEGFAEESRRFFDSVEKGMFVVLVSPVTLREIRRAPPRVQRVFDDLSEECVEFVDAEEEGDALADAYLATGILRKGAGNDAAHVATATVMGADMILTWNFKDILRYDRKKMFYGVNLMKGYHAVDILNPREVDYGEEE